MKSYTFEANFDVEAKNRAEAKKKVLEVIKSRLDLLREVI
jgi:hypothetical protein